MNLTAIRAALNTWLTSTTGLKCYWTARPQNWQGQAWLEARIVSPQSVGRDTLSYDEEYGEPQELALTITADTGSISAKLTHGGTSRTYTQTGGGGGTPAEATALAAAINADVSGWGTSGSAQFTCTPVGSTVTITSNALADTWTYSSLSKVTVTDGTDLVLRAQQQGLRSFILEVQVWSHSHADGKDALYYTELLRGNTLRYVDTFLAANLGFSEVRSTTMFDRALVGRDMSMAQIDLHFHTILAPVADAATNQWIETVDMDGDFDSFVISGEFPA
jgi:hypothetical protein